MQKKYALCRLWNILVVNCEVQTTHFRLKNEQKNALELKNDEKVLLEKRITEEVEKTQFASIKCDKYAEQVSFLFTHFLNLTFYIFPCSL